MAINDKNNWLDRKTFSSKTHFQRGLSRREHSREALLQDWYGPEFAANEIIAHQSKAKGINEILPAIFSEIGMEEAALLEDLISSWQQLVGIDVAKQTSPVALQRGVLIVEVANATWRYILEREYRSKMTERVQDFSGGKIRNIRLSPPGRNRMK